MFAWVSALPAVKQEGWHAPSKFNYLQAGLCFMLVEQALEIYLSLRQRQYLKRKQLPTELVTQVSAIDKTANAASNAAPSPKSMSRGVESDSNSDSKSSGSLLSQLMTKFTSSQEYNLDKNTFSFASMAFGFCTSAALLLSGFNVYLWVHSKSFASNMLGLDGDNELITGSLFLIAQSVVESLVSLPVSLYSTFRVEAKHGFNKTTVSLFFSDLLKNLLVNAALTVPLMGALVKVVRWGGDAFWLYCWALMFCFSIVMLTVYPNLIMPLFNKYSPLPDGELKSGIETLAASLSFPLTKLFEVDGSKRSSHSNAYLYGFFKDKRIVLYDTLIRNEKEPALECSTEEICAILGHELGHWSLSHTLKGFALQNLLYLATFKGFGLFLNDKDMYLSFGFNDTEMPVLIGLSLFGYIMAPIGAMLGLMLNSMTRKFEFEADAFAVQLGVADKLKAGLCKISISNLASFDVDPVFHMFHHSHPTLLERLRAMDAQEEHFQQMKMKAKTD